MLETDLETEDGEVRLIDFMPVRDQAPDLVRIVEGRRGRVPMRLDLVIRFDNGRLLPWVRQREGALTAVAGPNALCLRGDIPMRGEDLATVGDFTVAAGERRAMVATWFPSHEPLPRGDRSRGGAARHGIVVARVVGPLQLRRPVARGGADVADGAEGADVRSDRRHGRGADDVAARVAGRRAQLGLPLLLAARRHHDALRADADRLHRGGGGLARVAAARGGRRSGAPADHVRRLGRAAPDRVRSRLAARLRGLEPGAHRQPGARATAAGRLRRAGGCAVSGAPLRHRRRSLGLGLRVRAAGVAGVALVRARRGDLGGARAAPALHAFQGDVVGGVRSRDQVGRVFLPRGAARRGRRRRLRSWSRAGAPRAIGSTPRSARARSIRRATRSRSRTDRRGWTRACCSMPMVGFLPPHDPRIVGTVAAIERDLLRDGFVQRYRDRARR